MELTCLSAEDRFPNQLLLCVVCSGNFGLTWYELTVQGKGWPV